MLKVRFILILMVIFTGLIAFTGQPVTSESTITDDYRSNFVFDQDDNSTDSEEDDPDEDDDGIDDDKEDAYQRDIEVESEADQFRSKSVLRNGTTKDEFKVEFDVKSDNAAELSFEYSKEIGINATASNETELGYEVKFDEIVEFVDTGAPGYQNESEVQIYEIGQVGWNDLEVNYNSTSGFVVVNATSLDGVFTLIMKLSSSFLVDDNVTLSPNSLKIDVIINNFAYADVGTKLAVKTQVQTESELSIEIESEDEIEGIAENESQVGITAANATGFFSWSEIAMIDGELVDVLSSNIENSTEEEGEVSSKIYFTFNSTAQAQNIFWDPKLGVVSEAAKSNYQVLITPEDPVDPPASTDDDNPESTEGPTTQPDIVVDPPVSDNGSQLPFSFAWGILLLLATPIVRSRRKI